MDHVMARAPGYARLRDACDAPLLPTPAAVGEVIRGWAQARDTNVLAVDVGGATTDVFSVVAGEFRRTVSANLGVSYSIGHVCEAAGWPQVARWLPALMPLNELANRALNKMVRPTTLPESVTDLILEQAIAREAVRLALEQHRQAAQPAQDTGPAPGVADALRPDANAAPAWQMDRIDWIVGSGGLLAKAPRRQQAALLLIDALQPLGITQLVVDADFILPHLGVLNRHDAAAAQQVLVTDCLENLGVCVAPAGPAQPAGQPLLDCRLDREEGGSVSAALHAGELLQLNLPSGERAELSVEPQGSLDVGAGPGRSLRRQVTGGAAGVILDGRGRPLLLADDAAERQRQLRRWHGILALYPEATE
jgi:hypothetical protein